MSFRRSHTKSEKALLQGLRRGFVCWKGVGMLLVLVFLSLAGLVQAQPQAPVVWTPLRLLDEAPPEYRVRRSFCKGDTIVLVAVVNVSPPNDFSCARVSGDNGETWCPWHVFERRLPWADAGSPTVAITAQNIILCAQTQGNDFGFYRSPDLGMTWQSPTASVPGLRIQDIWQDTIYCTQPLGGQWTADEGVSFSPPRPFDGAIYGLLDGAMSSSSMHIVAVDFLGEPHQHLFYTRAPRLEGNFEPAINLNPDVFWTNRGIIDFGEDGTGMIAANVSFAPPVPGYSTVMLYISRDDGQTWLEVDTLGVVQGSGPFDSFVAHSGHQWIVAWVDTVQEAGFDSWGMRYRFSANNGRNWYPIRQCASLSALGVGSVSVLDFFHNKLNILWAFNRYNSVYGQYYAEIEGQVYPDTISPEIAVLDIPEDTVEVYQSVDFQVVVTDNDTLSEVRLIVADSTDQEWRIVMERAQPEENVYRGEWQVPFAGVFRWRIEAEDFWENVGTLPDGGWHSMITEGYITIAEDPSRRPSSSLLVTVYPNPCNGWPQITLSPDWFQQGPANITFYNLLGQRVVQKNVTSTTVSLDREVPIATGLFILEVSNSTYNARQKIIVLK